MKNMSIVEINIPNKMESYIKENSEFQSIITEVIYDYVEKKQDKITRGNLENNSTFKVLNNSLEEKLGL